MSRARRYIIGEDDEGFPEGWSDEAVVGAVRQNKDGSLTIQFQISVTADDGRYWCDNRVIRLPRDKTSKMGDSE